MGNLAWVAVGIGLLVVTAWNLTASTALGEARRAYTRGDLAICLQHALDHLNRQPWSHEGALLAARCLSRLDYADAAEPYYRRAGALSLDDLQIRAYGLVRGNHRQRAIQAYEAILARWPDNVTALRRLAAVQFTQNNIPEMLKLADRLIRVPSGRAIGYTLQGVVYHNDKDHEQAAAALEHVLKLDPELRVMPLPRALFWSHLADDVAGSGRLDDVVRYLTRALEQDPDAELVYKLGRTYFLQGAMDQAERCYRQAIEWNPKDFRFPLYLGKLEFQRKHFDAALNFLEKARTLAPEHADVLHNLSLVYRHLGRTSEADRLQEILNQRRRQAPAHAQRSPQDPWPPHAL